MGNPLDYRRVIIFLGFAFGLAWLVGLAIYLTGGLARSPEIVPRTGITLAVVLLAFCYMWAPALANILTRLVTREGWKDTCLRPRLRAWPYWAAAWFVPAVATLFGAALFFAIFPQYYDPSLKTLSDMLAKTGVVIPIRPWVLVFIQTIFTVLISPLANGLFTFGEEFGWRAYLQPKLMPLGGRKAVLLTGIIWGVWHWPIIAMGHNYGLEYPGAPWLGMLAMVWFTIVTGTFLGWVTIRAGSVWPAVIGHAAINGISGLPALFIQGTPNFLLGPLPVGLIGSVAWSFMALAIFLAPSAFKPVSVEPPPAPQTSGDAPASMR